MYVDYDYGNHCTVAVYATCIKLYRCSCPGSFLTCLQEQAQAAPQEVTQVKEEGDPEEPEDGVPRVLVTGASGFMATHVIYQLQQQGRVRVRGTVRSLKREEKVKPLRNLVPDAKYPLRLVPAELQDAESWTRAVKGCTYVYHIASPVALDTPRDENELIKPAVDGTINVLKACAESGTVKRVVLTSSLAAVTGLFTGNPGQPPDYVYSETDWADEASCTAYEKSKLKAEQAAWDFVKKLEEDKRFELVAVNPGYVQGPMFSAASGAGSAFICSSLLDQKMPGVLNIAFNVVDVRDVAAAQLAAMEKPEAAGNRYLLTSKIMTMQEVAQTLSEEFRPQGYKIPTRTIPKAVVWLGKLFDAGLKTLYPGIGKRVLLNNEKMRNELGVEPRPARESIIDTGYSLVELELVHRTPGYLGPPASRPKETAEGGETQPVPPEEQQETEQRSAESKPQETVSQPTSEDQH